MSPDIGVELDPEEIESFLQEQGLGVLGIARRGEAYTFPIAFAYDRGTDRCFFRFIMDEKSMKRTFAAEADRASLTVYEWATKNQWKSVVLRGQIRQVDHSELSKVATLFSEVGEEAALEVFNKPISEYETEWYELDADEVTGRGHFVGSRDSVV